MNEQRFEEFASTVYQELMDIRRRLEVAEQRIWDLEQRCEYLYAKREQDEEKVYQDRQAENDRLDGQWYREVNGLV